MELVSAKELLIAFGPRGRRSAIETICGRAYAGLLFSQAMGLIVGDGDLERDVPIP